jgi:hypothetical protein
MPSIPELPMEAVIAALTALARLYPETFRVLLLTGDVALTRDAPEGQRDAGDLDVSFGQSRVRLPDWSSEIIPRGRLRGRMALGRARLGQSQPA